MPAKWFRIMYKKYMIYQLHIIDIQHIISTKQHMLLTVRHIAKMWWQLAFKESIYWESGKVYSGVCNYGEMVLQLMMINNCRYNPGDPSSANSWGTILQPMNHNWRNRDDRFVWSGKGGKKRRADPYAASKLRWLSGSPFLPPIGTKTCCHPEGVKSEPARI